jgi:hypothetical protein
MATNRVATVDSDGPQGVDNDVAAAQTHYRAVHLHERYIYKGVMPMLANRKGARTRGRRSVHFLTLRRFLHLLV